MTTPGSDRGVSFSPETRFVESLSMFGGRRTSISFEEERQHAPHRFRKAPPPLRKDPSLMMFATHADARAAAERRKSLSPMSVATPSPPRREADDEERRRSAAADDEERRRSAAALEAERRRSDALRESREALARESDELCGNQIFNPTSMCAQSNGLDQTLSLCFENSTRAIDSSKNQPNRRRFDRARESLVGTCQTGG